MTWFYFASGCVFGLAGGIAPGPTNALVVSQTIRFGVREGLKVALAPALTDVPIVLVSVLLVGQLSRFGTVLGVISLIGAALLLFLALDMVRARQVDAAACDVAPRSLLKGFLANLLNPHPHLFWLTIGAPELIEANTVGRGSAVLFLVGFYFCLIGAKMVLAFLAGKSRELLKSRAYRYTNRLLALILVWFSVRFCIDGLRFLGVAI